MTKQQLEALAQTLMGLAKAFVPGDAGIIAGVVEVATDLNNAIHDIKNQSDANAQEVWNNVRTNAADAVEKFEASVKKAGG